MANSIASLRLVTSIDWTAFVETASAAETMLREDPARTYAAMTRATRDRYRHAVERIAKGTDLDEPAVAAAAVRAARVVRGRQAPILARAARRLSLDRRWPRRVRARVRIADRCGDARARRDSRASRAVLLRRARGRFRAGARRARSRRCISPRRRIDGRRLARSRRSSSRCCRRPTPRSRSCISS